jgi:hypothetical protein
LAYLWPGVSQFWGRDVRSGLVVAAGFSILLNLALVSTFVWVELLGDSFRNAGWVVILSTWVGWAILAYNWDRKYGRVLASGITDSLFEKAQKYYLESNWFEAERVLRKLLRHDKRDFDGRFLLATLLRHTGRVRDAEEELNRMERLDGAEKWTLEIQREREALRRFKERGDTQDGVQNGGQDGPNAETDLEGPPGAIENNPRESAETNLNSPDVAA